MPNQSSTASYRPDATTGGHRSRIFGISDPNCKYSDPNRTFPSKSFLPEPGAMPNRNTLAKQHVDATTGGFRSRIFCINDTNTVEPKADREYPSRAHFPAPAVDEIDYPTFGRGRNNSQ